MGLTAGQIPKVANVLNGGIGVIVSGSNISTLGSNTNGVDVYTAGSSGGRVISLVGSTSSTVAVNVFIWVLRSATAIPLGLVPVALNAGNVTGTRNIDFLNGTNIPGLPVDNVGRQYISLQANDVLRAGSLATLSSGTSCWVSAQGLDYQL